MKAPSSRRWLRFSLRALLVAVTLVCCWLGWESSVVRQRARLRKEAEATGSFDFLSIQEDIRRSQVLTRAVRVKDQSGSISWLREWLGDEAVYKIDCFEFDPNYSLELEGRLAKAFPEAQLQAVLRGSFRSFRYVTKK